MNMQTTSTVSFRVKGMTCGGCVRSVEEILDNVKGVVSLDVRVGSVTVFFDPALVNAEAVGAALRGAGYATEMDPGRAQ